MPPQVLQQRARLEPADSLEPHPENPNRGDVEEVRASIRAHGFYGYIIAQQSTRRILVGEHRWRAAQAEGMHKVPVAWVDVDDDEALRLLLVDNRTGELAQRDPEALRAILEHLRAGASENGDRTGLEGTGYTELDLQSLVDRLGQREKAGALARDFVVPPFSVLDSRQGYWRERKAAWKALGIQSELGRGQNLLKFSDTLRLPDPMQRRKAQQALERLEAEPESRAALIPGYHGRLAAGMTPDEIVAEFIDSHGGLPTGTSVFDPVLCEVVVRWYSPLAGHVLDPFAGGSVRGIVAAALGRRYTGVDLRAEQVEANRAQAAAILPQLAALEDGALRLLPGADQYTDGALTPIEQRGEMWLKRDDLYRRAGASGGKVRSIWALAQDAEGLITACSRQSPQAVRLARVAARLGVPARVHVPAGELTAELRAAEALGASIVRHRPGYNSVIIARAREDAAERGWVEVPFAVACPKAVELTAAQVPESLPQGVARIVVPVGSGTSLAGVLHGLQRQGHRLPVLGVVVGGDPEARLDELAPEGWRTSVELVRSPLKYGQAAEACELEGVPLDPMYEAKCLPYLQPGDLLWLVALRSADVVAEAWKPAEPNWLVGDSRHALAELVPRSVDLLFTCPPYYDLEQYSDDPADLSNAASWDEFCTAHAAIIKAAARALRPDRFCVWVVGDVREPGHGPYRDLPGQTVQAMRAAGLGLWGRLVLVMPAGNIMVRARKFFTTSRKVPVGHQEVLVFVKGDARAATEACGPAVAGQLVAEDE